LRYLNHPTTQISAQKTEKNTQKKWLVGRLQKKMVGRPAAKTHPLFFFDYKREDGTENNKKPFKQTFDNPPQHPKRQMQSTHLQSKHTSAKFKCKSKSKNRLASSMDKVPTIVITALFWLEEVGGVADFADVFEGVLATLWRCAAKSASSSEASPSPAHTLAYAFGSRTAHACRTSDDQPAVVCRCRAAFALPATSAEGAARLVDALRSAISPEVDVCCVPLAELNVLSRPHPSAVPSDGALYPFHVPGVDGFTREQARIRQFSSLVACIGAHEAADLGRPQPTSPQAVLAS
jgi:hypothetical protein